MFKYYAIEDVRIVKKLIGNEASIKLSPATSFNDPYEFKVVRNIDPANPLHRGAYFLKFPESSEEDFEIWKRSLTANSRWATEQDLRAGLLQSTTVACFTNTPKSNLMWSHYADRHRGICVEYDRRLVEYLEGMDQWRLSGQVRYQAEPPTIEDSDKIGDMAKKAFLFKQNEWKYESEHRFVYESQGVQYLPIEQGLIKRVIIGCKCPKRVVDEVLRICSDKISLEWSITMTDDYEVRTVPYEKGKFPMRSFF